VWGRQNRSGPGRENGEEEKERNIIKTLSGGNTSPPPPFFHRLCLPKGISGQVSGPDAKKKKPPLAINPQKPTKTKHLSAVWLLPVLRGREIFFFLVILYGEAVTRLDLLGGRLAAHSQHEENLPGKTRQRILARTENPLYLQGFLF